MQRKPHRIALEPHSRAWFAAVDRAAPRFGRHVRFTIQCEQSLAVCSICGDGPTGDYRIVEAVSTPRGVPTVRLCPDCLAASAADGEMLLPLKSKAESPAWRAAQAGRDSLAAIWKKIYLPRR
jgi:hypothetical protein